MDFCLLLKIQVRIGKNISKNLTGKCSQKRFDHTEHSATDRLKKLYNRIVQKQLQMSM